MKVVELFSGTCAFTEALINIGIKPSKVYYSEVNKHAIANTRYNHPDYIFLGDVMKVSKGNFPENEQIDLMTFGSPCQGFSKAGKNNGTDHEGSVLINEALRLLDELKPKKFVWENVEGVLTKTHRKDFWAIIKAMYQKGYTLEWQLCNTNWFLPQNRSRIYVIGHRIDTISQKVFPLNGNGKSPYGKKSSNLSISSKSFLKWTPTQIENCFLDYSSTGMPRHGGINRFGDVDIFTDFNPEFTRKTNLSDLILPNADPKYNLSDGQMKYLMKDNGKRFDKGFAKILNTDSQIALTILKSQSDNWTGNFVLERQSENIVIERQSENIVTIDLKQLQSKTAQGMIKTDVVGTLYDDCRIAIIIGEIRTFQVDGETRWSIDQSPTVKATWRECGTNNIVIGNRLEGDNFRIRRLTEIECESLQGLKPNHTKYGIYDGVVKEIPMSKRFEMLGNGITATLFEALATKMYIKRAKRISSSQAISKTA